MSQQRPSQEPARPVLHLVFGGELRSVEAIEFRDPGALDVVGIYPSYETAFHAWKAASQRTVDNALMRYFVVHLHRLLEPQMPGAPKEVETRS